LTYAIKSVKQKQAKHLLLLLARTKIWRRKQMDISLAALRKLLCAEDLDLSAIASMLLSSKEDELQLLLRYLNSHFPLYDGGWFAGQRQVFNLIGVEIPMRWIPAGQFWAGYNAFRGYENEGPKHEVTIKQGFWIGETPVTITLFDQLKATKGDFDRGVRVAMGEILGEFDMTVIRSPKRGGLHPSFGACCSSTHRRGGFVLTAAFEKLSAKHLLTLKGLINIAPPSVQRHFACDCAERALLGEVAAGKDPLRASWLAVRVARLFAEGRATEGDLRKAYKAARIAAYCMDWVVNRKSYAAERAYWAAQAAYSAAMLFADNAAICAADTLGEWAIWTVEEGVGRKKEAREAREKVKAWQVAHLRLLIEQHEQARSTLLLCFRERGARMQAAPSFAKNLEEALF